MHGSRSERRAGLAALLIAACLGTPPAMAQVGPPLRLVQPPASPSIAPDTISPTSPDASSTDHALPSSVQATPLAPVDPAWSGTLSTTDGALPESLWQGTEKAFVMAALPRLQPTLSPTLQDLARRLLLSNAVAPIGEDPPKSSLATLRLDRLVALGYVDAAAQLIDQLPWKADPEPIDRLRVEIGFLKNDTAGACRQVQEAIGRHQDVWWDRAQIACQALAGDAERAALGLSLLRERKAPRDQLFDSLIEAIDNHAATKVEHLPDPTPVRLALLAAVKLPLPGDALDTADPALLRAWATNANVAAERRLAAAERAAALGALPLDELRLIYTETPFKPDERKTAIRQAGDSPHARALLYATANQETTPAVRAEALQSLLQAGLKRGEFVVTARLVASLLLEMTPSPDLDWLAPMAARALYAVDRPQEARRWAEVGGTTVQAPLFLIARLAEGENGPGWPKGGLKSIIEGLQPRDATLEPAKLLLAGALLQAVGEPVRPADWATLVALPPTASAPMPNAALWLDGRDAVARHRLGAALLDVIAMAQTGGRLSSEPIVIAETVAHLSALGMGVEARHLALEAALAAGL